MTTKYKYSLQHNHDEHKEIEISTSRSNEDTQYSLPKKYTIKKNGIFRELLSNMKLLILSLLYFAAFWSATVYLIFDETWWWLIFFVFIINGLISTLFCFRYNKYYNHTIHYVRNKFKFINILHSLFPNIYSHFTRSESWGYSGAKSARVTEYHYTEYYDNFYYFINNVSTEYIDFRAFNESNIHCIIIPIEFTCNVSTTYNSHSYSLWKKQTITKMKQISNYGKPNCKFIKKLGELPIYHNERKFIHFWSEENTFNIHNCLLLLISLFGGCGMLGYKRNHIKYLFSKHNVIMHDLVKLDFKITDKLEPRICEMIVAGYSRLNSIQFPKQLILLCVKYLDQIHPFTLEQVSKEWKTCYTIYS